MDLAAESLSLCEKNSPHISLALLFSPIDFGLIIVAFAAGLQPFAHIIWKAGHVEGKMSQVAPAAFMESVKF